MGPYGNQYRVLQRRALQAYTRNPLNVAGRTMMAIFIGILGGLVFMKDVQGEQCSRTLAPACRKLWISGCSRAVQTMAEALSRHLVMIAGFCLDKEATQAMHA